MGGWGGGGGATRGRVRDDGAHGYYDITTPPIPTHSWAGRDSPGPPRPAAPVAKVQVLSYEGYRLAYVAEAPRRVLRESVFIVLREDSFASRVMDTTHDSYFIFTLCSLCRYILYRMH